MEHFLEVLLRVYPGGDGIAEKDKVLDHSGGVHTDHVTDASEGRVFLLVVTDVAQRDAPKQRNEAILK